MAYIRLSNDDKWGSILKANVDECILISKEKESSLYYIYKDGIPNDDTEVIMALTIYNDRDSRECMKVDFILEEKQDVYLLHLS